MREKIDALNLHHKVQIRTSPTLGHRADNWIVDENNAVVRLGIQASHPSTGILEHELCHIKLAEDTGSKLFSACYYGHEVDQEQAGLCPIYYQWIDIWVNEVREKFFPGFAEEDRKYAAETSGKMAGRFAFNIALSATIVEVAAQRADGKATSFSAGKSGLPKNMIRQLSNYRKILLEAGKPSEQELERVSRKINTEFGFGYDIRVKDGYYFLNGGKK